MPSRDRLRTITRGAAASWFGGYSTVTLTRRVAGGIVASNRVGDVYSSSGINQRVVPVAASLTFTPATAWVALTQAYNVTPIMPDQFGTGRSLIFNRYYAPVFAPQTDTDVTPIATSLALTAAVVDADYAVPEPANAAYNGLWFRSPTYGTPSTWFRRVSESVIPIAGSITITPALLASVKAKIYITPAAAALELTALVAPVTTDTDTGVVPVAESLALTPMTLVVDADNPANVRPVAATLTLAPGTLSVNIDVNIIPIASGLTLTPATAAAWIGDYIYPETQDFTLSITREFTHV